MSIGKITLSEHFLQYSSNKHELALVTTSGYQQGAQNTSVDTSPIGYGNYLRLSMTKRALVLSSASGLFVLDNVMSI